MGASSLMSIVTVNNVCKIDRGMRWLYRLLPGYSLGIGIANIASLETGPTFVATCLGTTVEPGFTYDGFSMDAAGGAGLCIASMAVESVVYIALAVALDAAMSNPRLRRLLSRDPVVVDAPFQDDVDVAAEAQRVQELADAGGEAIAGSGDVVLIDRLRKVRGGRRKMRGCLLHALMLPSQVYADKKVAVKDLSFGVQSGQIFGFLGINGAGAWAEGTGLAGELAAQGHG